MIASGIRIAVAATILAGALMCVGCARTADGSWSLDARAPRRTYIETPIGSVEIEDRSPIWIEREMRGVLAYAETTTTTSLDGAGRPVVVSRATTGSLTLGGSTDSTQSVALFIGLWEAGKYVIQRWLPIP